MALEKRFFEYETMGELFENMEEDLMALTLWKRVLYCIKRLLEVLCEHLGVTIDEQEESLINEKVLHTIISSYHLSMYLR